jgi:SAM-dependent methyltransferase
MRPYGHFARFYDPAMDDPVPRAARVQEFVDRHLPGAQSILELGCGTGSILARLTSFSSLTGLDQSPEMLAIAREKVPTARLVEGDMSSFALGEQFDVIVCVFDSLNHLLTFEAWESTFATVHDHLHSGGLFIFDVNTVGEFRRLGEEGAYVHDFDDNVLIMDVSLDEGFDSDRNGGGLSHWDIRIFEDVGESQYLLHHEIISELAVPLTQLRASLASRFILLEEMNETGGPPTDDSVKAHFALRRP